MDLKIFIIVLILIAATVFSIFLARSLELYPFFSEFKTCSSNSDCLWKITNCCPESSGAKWACVNKIYEGMNCSSAVICPQVISPKPTNNCICKNGSCGIE